MKNGSGNGAMLDDLVRRFGADLDTKSERRKFKAEVGLAPSAFRRGRYGWHVRITRGKRANGTWDRPTIFLGTYEDLPDLDAAKAAAKRTLTADASPPAAEPQRAPTFAAFRRWYLDERVRWMRPGTRRTQRSVITRHLARFDATAVDAIKPVAVQAWIGEMDAAGVSVGTIRQRVGVLRRMLIAARAAGIDAEIPRDLYFPADDRVRYTHDELAFTRAEAFTLIDAADAEDRAAFGLALWLGLRAGEIVALTWRDVDVDERRLTVRAQVQRGAAVAPKTRGSIAVLKLPGELVDSLEAWRAGAPSSDGEWLFPSPRRDGPIATDTLRDRLARACAACSVEYKHGLHAFRRRLCDALCEQDKPLREISAALRHKQLTTTLRYLSPAHRADVEAAFEAAAADYTAWRRVHRPGPPA